MAKITVSKDLVLSIANKDNKKFVKIVDEKVNSLLASSIEALSSQVSYISLDNVVLQPANELFNDSMVDNSYFIYLLGIESVQLDLNTAKKSRFWDNFKTRLKNAWQNRKLFKKKKKRKKKKQQPEETILDVKFEPSKYTVYNMAEDLQKTMCNYLLPTTIVYQGNNKLEIVGKEDFGPNVKIVIYLTSLVNGSFKYYSGKRKDAFINLYIDERYSKLKEKKKAAGKNFVKILKVLNALYFNLNGRMPNQIFMESVLYFCPSDLFKGEDVYTVFLKIINYVSINSLRKIPSIVNSDKSIIEDKLCGDCGIGFNKIIESIVSEEEKKSNREIIE